MTTATKTYETKNSKIEISLTRKVSDKINYADGYNVKTGREIYESYDLTLTHKPTGKIVKTGSKTPGGLLSLSSKFNKLPAGAYASINNGVYLTEEVYNACVAMIADLDAEVSKTDEQIALEAEAAARKIAGEANMKRQAAEDAERQNSSGWCKRCQDWTYGDCGHN